MIDYSLNQKISSIQDHWLRTMNGLYSKDKESLMVSMEKELNDLFPEDSDFEVVKKIKYIVKRMMFCHSIKSFSCVLDFLYSEFDRLCIVLFGELEQKRHINNGDA